MKRFLSLLLAFLLAVVMALQLPVTVIGETLPLYLSDVQISVASTAEGAKKWLTDNGYTVINQNLRQSSGGYYVYMGFKTSSDEKDAITDLKLCNMNSGLENINYAELAKRWQMNLDSVATDVKLGYAEIRENYNTNSPLAISAVELLNVFNVDGTPLGYYLIDENRTLENFEDLILMCSNEIVAVIYNAMYMGVADPNPDTDSFATRLVKNLASEKFTYESLKNDESYAHLDDNADVLLEVLIKFREEYETAYEELEFYDEEAGAEYDDDDLDADSEFWEKYLDEALKNSPDEDEQTCYRYAELISTVKVLEKYECTGGDYGSLAEYILACGEYFDTSDDTQYDIHRYRVYPLADALTDGQIATVKMSAFTSVVATLDANNKTSKSNIENAIIAIRGKMSESDIESISVYQGVDREIYNETVGLTSTTARVTKADADYIELTKTEDPDELTETCIFIAEIVGAVAASSLALSIIIAGATAFKVGTAVLSVYSAGYTAILAGSMSYAASAVPLSMTTGAIVSGIIGTALVAVAVVAIAIIVICFLIAIIKKIIDDSDLEEEPEYIDMPTRMYDTVNGNYIEYFAVRDQNNSPADINAGEGSEWDGLFYTKSSGVGSPIRYEGGIMFRVQQNSGATQDGYVSLKRFGNRYAADFNEFDKGSTQIFFFYRTVNSLNGMGEKGDGTGKYLYDIELHTEDTAAACAAYFNKQKDYAFIPTNLTNVEGKCTYIGFTTTDDPNDAITDIRVCPYYKESTFRFGTDSTGNYAQYTKCGTTPTDSGGFFSSLYYTKSPNNGSAIYADLDVKETTISAKTPEGWEPVNMFSGGGAFNFGFVGGEIYQDTAKCIFFHPEEQFTSVNSTEYISGFCFVSGKTPSYNSDECGYYTLEDFGRDFGYYYIPSLGKYNLTKGATEGDTYIMMSTTYNPYRAITDATIYTASCSADAVAKTFAVGSTGYVACETLEQYEDYGILGSDYIPFLRSTSSYVTKHTAEGCTNVRNTYDDWAVMGDAYYAENIRQRALYVAGPVDGGKNAIKVNDMHLSTTDSEYNAKTGSSDTSYRQVHDVLNTYSTTADNLCFEYKAARAYNPTKTGAPIFLPQYCTFENHLYMSFKGTSLRPTKKKYVENIYMAFSENKQGFAEDEAILNLLVRGDGEIIRTNVVKSSGNQSRYIDSDGHECYKKVGGNAAYVLVTYTDTLSKGLRAAATEWYDSIPDDFKTQNTLALKGTEFKCASNAVKCGAGNYVLYTSSNNQLGPVVTSVLVDTFPYTDYANTVVGSDGNGHVSQEYFIKLCHDPGYTSSTAVNKFEAAICSSRLDCAKELLSKGCTVFIDRNKNLRIGGKCVYFGYDTTGDKSDPNIITDMKTKVYGSAGADTITENGITYKRATGDMNKSLNSSYTYVYTTTDKSMNPIGVIDTTQHMAREIKYFKHLATENWTITDNLNEGLDVACKLCFKRLDEWSIKTVSRDKSTTLRLFYNGKMPSFSTRTRVTYVKVLEDGTVLGATIKYVEYYPEWSDYNDRITDVVIESTVQNINALALKNITSLKRVTVLNDNITVAAGAIPAGVTVYCRCGSTAETYATANGLNVAYISAYSGNCGSASTYSKTDGVLNIQGTGEMYKYTTPPWGTDVKTAVVEDGITRITAGALSSDTVEKVTVKNKNCVLDDGSVGKNATIECYYGSYAYDYAVKNGNPTSILANGEGEADGVKWTIYGNRLRIEGDTIKNYTKASNTPWYSLRYKIEILELSGVTVIGDNAFNGFKNLTTVTASSVNIIGNNAFSGCTSLKAPVNPNGVIILGNNAYKSTGIRTAVTGTQLATVGTGAFDYSSIKTYVVLGDSLLLDTSKLPSDSTVHTTSDAVKNAAESMGFTAIKYSSLDTSGEIGKGAYWGITSDNALNIFGYCTALNNLYESTSEYIALFPWCFGPTPESVNVFDGIFNIPEYAFCTVQSIKEVTLGEDVKSIGDHAFSTGSSSGIKLTVNNSLCTFGNELFDTGKVEIVGYTTSTAEAYANSNGYTFTDIAGENGEVSDGPAMITDPVVPPAYITKATPPPENTFSWSYGDGVLTVSGNGEVPSLTSDNLTPPWSENLGDIRELVISEGITYIGENSFASLPALTTVTIPDTVTDIGKSAFENCTALSTVNIGSGIKSIDSTAFSGCTAEATVKITSESFDLSPLGLNITKIIAPAGSAAEAYATDNGIEFEDYSGYLLSATVSGLGSTVSIVIISSALCLVGVGAVIYKKKTTKTKEEEKEGNTK